MSPLIPRLRALDSVRNLLLGDHAARADATLPRDLPRYDPFATLPFNLSLRPDVINDLPHRQRVELGTDVTAISDNDAQRLHQFLFGIRL